MRCTICGQETGSPVESRCNRCQEKNHVHILTPEERERFDGITIDDESRGYCGEYERSESSNQRIYIKQVSFGSGGVISKLVIAAIIAVVVFFVLPMALLFVGGLTLFWLLFRMIRRS